MPHLLLIFNNNSLCLFHSFRFCDIVEVYSYACACLPSWTPHKVWVPSGVSVSRANVIIMRAAATKAKFKFILVTTEHLYSGSCSDSECYKQTMWVYCTRISGPSFCLKGFVQEYKKSNHVSKIFHANNLYSKRCLLSQ